ncbi:MAG: putative pyridoxine 5'-phosphate oxidase superfamily flavin-nucleotide-binding protein [Thalassolituus oleivorans]
MTSNSGQMFYSYGSNPPLYGEWQRYLRDNQPPTLMGGVTWPSLFDTTEMTRKYPALAFGPSVKNVQQENGSRTFGERLEKMEFDDHLIGEREQHHIEGLDHFYMASVGESGWPYVQFRGGPKGFLKVLSPTTLGFADFRGNVQYISTGNVRNDGRVSLMLLDQARKTRLKIFARAEVREMDDALRQQLVDPDYKAVVERAYVFRVEAFDWNCPQHIVPRFSMEELRQADPAGLAEALGWDAGQ